MNTADISACGKYRYYLERTVVQDNDKRLLFIMLNPSTADGFKDDATIRRCKMFTRVLGFGLLSVVNLHAYRATKPKDLVGVDDTLGPHYDKYIKQAIAEADMIICAWGNNGKSRAKDFMLTYCKDIDVHCLYHTQDDQPAHPLFAPSLTKPIKFKPRYMDRILV